MSGGCRDWGHTPIWIGHGGCASTLQSASPLLSSSGSSWIAGGLTKPALNPEEPLPGAACPRGRARPRGTELLYVRASCAYLPTPLKYRSCQGVSPGRDGRVRRMVKMARSQCRASMCYLCVGVNWRWVSVMWCRRQWHGLSTVFRPSRGRVRLHYECTWCEPIRSRRSPGAWMRPQERKSPEGVRGARLDGHGRFPKWKAEIPQRRTWRRRQQMS